MPLSFIDPPRRSVFEKTLMTLWSVTLLGFGVMLALPFRFGLLRAGMIAAVLLIWIGGAYLYRRSRTVFALSLIAPTALTLFFLSPGKPVDGEQLRAAYLDSLRSLQGTMYVWGGETRVGIDCSGLVRGALVDANLREGIRTANPALLRTAANMWWHDCSAKALGESYRGWTRPLAEANSLNEANYDELRPGDIAVTESGVHTLAYLGYRTWIQADPVPMRVVRTGVPSKEGWFIQRVRLLRWTELESPPTQVASAAKPSESPAQ